MVQVAVAIVPILAAVAVALVLLAERIGDKWSALGAKMAASTAFLAFAFAFGAFDTLYGGLIFAGLALSWVGDLLLALRTTGAFIGGLVLFLLAHLTYAVGFVVAGVSWTVVIMALFVFGTISGAIGRLILVHVPADLKLPVRGYMMAITGMLLLGLGSTWENETVLIGVGALLFYASDLFVARNRFIAPSWWNRAYGLPLYYAGQFCLAASIGAVA